MQRLQHDVGARLPRALVLPSFEPLVDVLDHDDGGVDHRADGDGDAPEGHDVRGQPHRLHGNEGEQDRDGKKERGHQRRAEVEQEKQDDQRDDDQLLDQRVLERLDAGANQPRTVVGGHDFDARRQRGLELRHARLHGVDHLQRVGARTRDHDAADGLALSVEIRQPAPLCWSDAHRGYVAEQHGRAHLRTQHDLLEVLGRLHITPAAHVMLGAADLQDPPSHVRVGHAHLVHHGAQGNVECREPIGIDIDLILLDEPADARHLGDAGHGLQRVADVPVL